jgi:hypothetical protein
MQALCAYWLGTAGDKGKQSDFLSIQWGWLTSVRVTPPFSAQMHADWIPKLILDSDSPLVIRAEAVLLITTNRTVIEVEDLQTQTKQTELAKGYIQQWSNHLKPNPFSADVRFAHQDSWDKWGPVLVVDAMQFKVTNHLAGIINGLE